MYYDPKKVIINFQWFRFILTISFALLFSINLLAQASNEGIIFQALARDAFNNPAANRNLYVQANIIQSTKTGTIVLSEEHFTTADETGVFTINIGLGKRVGGARDGLQDIPWADGPYFVNMKIAITPIIPNPDWYFNKNWIDLGTTLFGVVPYALHVLGASTNSTSIIDTNLFKTKLNISDSTTQYVTPAQLASKTIDISPIHVSLVSKLNFSDTTSMLSHYRTSMIANDAKVTSLFSDTASMLAHYRASMIDNDVYKISNDLVIANLSANKLNASDTLKLSTWKLYAADTVNLAKWKLNSADTLKLSTWKLYAADTANLARWKLNSADTTIMLSNYRTSMIANDAKVSSLLSDTAAMLAHYRTSMIANDAKVSSLLSDTASMLSHYRTSMIANDAKVSSLLSDTASMLANYKASMIDKDAYKISNDLVIANLSSNKLSSSDTLKLSTWKLYSADTVNLAKWKLNSADTINLSKWKLNSADTANLSTWKLNKSDTALMLANYKASMIDKDAYKISNDFAVSNLSANKLSSSDTLKLSNWKLYSADTANLAKWKLNSADTLKLSNWKLYSADTANLAKWKLNSADTLKLSTWKLYAADTANLAKWKLNSADTLKLSTWKLYSADTANLAKWKLNSADTANLAKWKLNSIDTLNLAKWKLNAADTATMLSPYLTSLIGLNSNKLGVTSSHYLGTTLISNTRNIGAIALTGITSIDGNAATASVATSATNVSGIVLGANGGTGIANTGKTITLGGNISTAGTLTTEGAFGTVGSYSTSLVSTASTYITLPTTGTLATLSGTETLNNKTLVAPILGDATGTSLAVSSAVSASTLSATNVNVTNVNATSITATGDIKAKRYLLTYNAAATSSIDLSTGNIFQILLTASATFSLPTPSASTVGTYLVKFKQNNTGGNVVTFSNTALTTTKLYWAGGSVPIITSGANKTDFMTIICDGTSYYATIVQNFY